MILPIRIFVFFLALQFPLFLIAQKGTDSLRSAFFIEQGFGVSNNYGIKIENLQLTDLYNRFENEFSFGFSKRMGSHFHWQFAIGRNTFSADQSLTDSSNYSNTGILLYREMHFIQKNMCFRTGIGIPFSVGRSRWIFQPQINLTCLYAINEISKDLLSKIDSENKFESRYYTKFGGKFSVGIHTGYFINRYLVCWAGFSMDMMSFDAKPKDYYSDRWIFKGDFYTAGIGISFILPEKQK